MIEIKDLVKTYGTIEALKGISFNVNEGEILGFLGPNGAGKSTTLNIMTGYLSATAGNVIINGHDILDEPTVAKKSIGFLPEIPPLYSEMTVREYLEFVHGLKGCTLPRKSHVKEVCDLVRISDAYNRIIRNLSKGYRQRVGIAQALIGDPKVLIFDEPTIGLDPKQIIEIRNLIKMLGRDHTVILSTHVLPEVQAVCDRIVIINKGTIIANERTEDLALSVSNTKRLEAKVSGPQDDVLREIRAISGVKYAEISGRAGGDAFSYLIDSDPGIDIRKPLFFALAKKGWPMIGLEGAEANLEDIFMKLVDSQASTKRSTKKLIGRTAE
ncbi:MAG TPA: ABC transporter ATP-binding protein [Bacillota bacterium]|nr:ABC transporter ATP-binding protein [Bacillota bacterium]